MFCFETGVCNVLQTFWKVTFITCFSGLKNSHQVGDFQVATGGGFWVATRAKLNVTKDLQKLVSDPPVLLISPP
jgi:hypothetical protein